MKRHLVITLSSLLALPLVVLQFILFALNTSNADMAHYIIRYNNIALLGPRYFQNSVDVVFNYLMFFVQRFSMDYQVFLISCGIIIFSLLVYVCHYYKVNQLVFFIFFMLTTFFIEAVIVRQFLASVLMTYAFTLTTRGEETKRVPVLVLVILLLTCGLHITAFLSLLYYLSLTMSLRKVITGSIIGTVVSFPLITLILPRLTAVLGSKFALYTAAVDGSWVSFLAKTLFLIVTSLLMLWSYRYMNRHQNEFNNKQRQLALLALKASIINAVFLPLMRVDISFERLLIVPIFFYLLTISALFNAQMRVPYRKVLLWSFCIVWSLMTFRIFVYSDRVGTIEALLQYNLLW